MILSRLGLIGRRPPPEISSRGLPVKEHVIGASSDSTKAVVRLKYLFCFRARRRAVFVRLYARPRSVALNFALERRLISFVLSLTFTQPSLPAGCGQPSSGPSTPAQARPWQPARPTRP